MKNYLKYTKLILILENIYKLLKIYQIYIKLILNNNIQCYLCYVFIYHVLSNIQFKYVYLCLFKYVYFCLISAYPYVYFSLNQLLLIYNKRDRAFHFMIKGTGPFMAMTSYWNLPDHGPMSSSWCIRGPKWRHMKRLSNASIIRKSSPNSQLSLQYSRVTVQESPHLAHVR